MPGCNVYNDDHQQLLVKFFDYVTANDLQKQAASLASHKQISGAKRKYISFFATTGFADDVTMEEVAKVVEVLKDMLKAQKDFKAAFVAPDSESFGVARMFQVCLKRVEGLGEVKIFTDKEEAFGWLGGSRRQWQKMREEVSTLCRL